MFRTTNCLFSATTLRLFNLTAFVATHEINITLRGIYSRESRTVQPSGGLSLKRAVGLHSTAKNWLVYFFADTGILIENIGSCFGHSTSEFSSKRLGKFEQEFAGIRATEADES